MDKKVVTIGGGTGSGTILRGLKQFTKNITAIVTVADDGGGSGVIREDLKMIPPGDIRSCLIALANTEEDMERLMLHRFKRGRYENQSLGNLLLVALTEIYGSFEEGLRAASKLLAITGQVLPMTLDDVTLYAQLEDGSVIQGESNITFLTRQQGGAIDHVFIKPELPKPLPEAVEAILQADIVILGPGSLYTSIMPNLLVKEIVEALEQTQAKIVYVCNLVTQAGETDHYGVVDHYKAVMRELGQAKIDAVAVNTKPIPAYEELRYQMEQNSDPVYLTEEDRRYFEERGVALIEGDFLAIKNGTLRHQAVNLSQAILEADL